MISLPPADRKHIRHIWQSLQCGPCMLVLILPTWEGWKAEWTSAGKKVTQIFNPRRGRGLNLGPSGWEAEILPLCQPLRSVEHSRAGKRKMQPQSQKRTDIWQTTNTWRNKRANKCTTKRLARTTRKQEWTSRAGNTSGKQKHSFIRSDKLVPDQRASLRTSREQTKTKARRNFLIFAKCLQWYGRTPSPPPLCEHVFVPLSESSMVHMSSDSEVWQQSSPTTGFLSSYCYPIVPW